jgi:uncharacterized protein (TIGR00730 family)
MSDREAPARQPPVPPPRERLEPLPEQRPKAAADDFDAPGRVRRIMESPGYRQADQDIEFLQQPQMRGVRLQLDYWKAEHLLEAHGIEHTIVVFGSTRIPEPAEARRRLDAARAALDARRGDAQLRRAVSIAERVVANSRYYDIARDFGRVVGDATRDENGNRLVVVTGGGPGVMEAANRGAFDADAETVGLNITLPQEQFPNPYITPDLAFRFHYFAMRKLHFVQRARALVAFPGGYGTLDELFETLALVQTRKIEPVPIVLVGEAFWCRAVDFDFLLDEGVIDPEDSELFWVAETADEIWTGINEWYRRKGESLIPRRPRR